MTIFYASTVTLLVIATIVLVTIAVAKSGSRKDDGITRTIYKVRTFYFAALSLCIVIVLVLTLGTEAVPYPSFQTGEADLKVDAIGTTWNWELERTELPVGKVIEFHVRSEDVTHGFGIYDENGRLLTQVQAMPGYTNKLRYRFEKPGIYHVLCMEYCGRAHHMMMTEFRVMRNGNGNGGVEE